MLSGLCAVHCLLMPAVLLVLPLWRGAHVLHEIVHPVLSIILVPVTIRAMRRSVDGVRWLQAGLAAVWAALPVHALLGETAGLALTLVGSALLIAGHRCNLRCCAVSQE